MMQEDDSSRSTHFGSVLSLPNKDGGGTEGLRLAGGWPADISGYINCYPGPGNQARG